MLAWRCTQPATSTGSLSQCAINGWDWKEKQIHYALHSNRYPAENNNNNLYICVIKRSNVHSRLSPRWVHSNSWTFIMLVVLVATWALFGSWIPTMYNRTSCAQVQELLWTHHGDNRECTLDLLITHIYNISLYIFGFLFVVWRWFFFT